MDRTNNIFFFSILFSVAPELDEELSSDEEEEDSDTIKNKEEFCEKYIFLFACVVVFVAVLVAWLFNG